MMLTLAASLPPGALIGGEKQLLEKAIARTNGAWFCATSEAMQFDGEKIAGWREASGAVVAEAVGPNTGNSRFEPGPPAALVCDPGVNCGFAIQDFAPKVDRFTAAVVYSSPRNEAKTLVAVSTGPARNVIFLNESEGTLFATDRLGTFVTRLPSPDAKSQPRLAIFSYTGRGILLRAGGKTVEASGRAPEMKHSGQFFIGCRSNRPGLVKTLGLSHLHDVFFWPDRALIGSPATADVAALEALDRYHRWAY